MQTPVLKLLVRYVKLLAALCVWSFGLGLLITVLTVAITPLHIAQPLSAILVFLAVCCVLFFHRNQIRKVLAAIENHEYEVDP